MSVYLAVCVRFYRRTDELQKCRRIKTIVSGYQSRNTAGLRISSANTFSCLLDDILQCTYSVFPVFTKPTTPCVLLDSASDCFYAVSKKQDAFYPRDAMLVRVIAIATCPSVCPPRAGIVSKRRN